MTYYFGEDCRDLTKINRERKYEGCDMCDDCFDYLKQ